jgi:hypothetical protein
LSSKRFADRQQVAADPSFRARWAEPAIGH